MNQVKLNARGTIIMLDRELAKKSEVLSVWFDTTMKDVCEDTFVLNYSPETVHNLIDYLNDREVEIQKIKHIADYLQVSLDSNLIKLNYQELLNKTISQEREIEYLKKQIKNKTARSRIKETLVSNFEKHQMGTCCELFLMLIIFIICIFMIYSTIM